VSKDVTSSDSCGSVSFFIIKPVSRAHRPLLKRATDASLEPMASTSIAFRPVVVACTARLDQSRAVAPRPARIMTTVPKAKLIGTLASVALLAAHHPPMAFAEDTEPAGVSKAVTATLLECASDPTCAAERSNLLAAGAYAPPIDVVEDEDEAVRRAICPRNPTADVCRSKKDRMKVNDSKCKIPIGLGCAMWK
jgi:hypothetical protein